MIVYVYEKESNVKLAVFRNVTEIMQTYDSYIFYSKKTDTTTGVPRHGIKITVYGF